MIFFQIGSHPKIFTMRIPENISLQSLTLSSVISAVFARSSPKRFPNKLCACVCVRVCGDREREKKEEKKTKAAILVSGDERGRPRRERTRSDLNRDHQSHACNPCQTGCTDGPPEEPHDDSGLDGSDEDVDEEVGELLEAEEVGTDQITHLPLFLSCGTNWKFEKLVVH